MTQRNNGFRPQNGQGGQMGGSYGTGNNQQSAYQDSNRQFEGHYGADTHYGDNPGHPGGGNFSNNSNGPRPDSYRGGADYDYGLRNDNNRQGNPGYGSRDFEQGGRLTGQGYGGQGYGFGADNQHPHDQDYQQWRDEQMRALDEDYKAWRAERYSTFSNDFNTWRKTNSDRQRGGQGNPAGSTQHNPGAASGTNANATSPGGSSAAGTAPSRAPK